MGWTPADAGRSGPGPGDVRSTAQTLIGRPYRDAVRFASRVVAAPVEGGVGRDVRAGRGVHDGLLRRTGASGGGRVEQGLDKDERGGCEDEVSEPAAQTRGGQVMAEAGCGE